MLYRLFQDRTHVPFMLRDVIPYSSRSVKLQKSPVPSSSAGINPSAAASTLTVRPSPPLRHTTSSPQLPPSTSPNVTNSSNPNIYFPPQKSRQNSNRSSTKPTSSRPSKRSPLPDSWQESTKPREPGRTLRRRLPSEKLLARSGSLTSATAAAAAVASRKAHISPVTVSCRSASVDATTRHRRRKELPLLTPSADTGAWPWMAGSSSGNGKKEHSLPKINVHAANGKRSLARTGSTSSARGFSSLSRSGSIYANLSRRDRADDSSWAEYSHRNSPVVGNYKHLPQLQLDHAIHTDEDEDSDNEPHLANILAPHVSPLASPQPNPAKSARPGPVGRQQSIQSLRACLDKHESRGRRASVATPRVISPQFASFHDQNTIPPASAVPALTLPSPMQDGNDSQGLIKRRSMGHFEAQRRRDTSGRLSRQELQLQRQRERMENNDHVIERGRSGSKALLPPGLGTHHWQANERTTTAALASSRSPSQSVARTNGPPARRGTGDKPNDKLSQKELETERLLWGTSWGRK